VKLGPFAALRDQWRETAEELADVAPHLAALYRKHATQLEKAEALYLDEGLTVAESAAESGYSPDHIRRLLKDGRLQGSGGRNPTIRRGDLPRKPSAAAVSVETVLRLQR
jgi:hypothetical protein